MCRAANFVEFCHQIIFRMETAGRVDDQYVDSASLPGLQCIVKCSRGVTALAGADHLDAGTLAPDLQLLNGSGTEGVGSAQEN